MVNFNCDFLHEGKRYLTFPVDFLKAQTILFHKSCNHFKRNSLLMGVKSLQKNEVFVNRDEIFLYFLTRDYDVIMGVSHNETS